MGPVLFIICLILFVIILLTRKTLLIYAVVCSAYSYVLYVNNSLTVLIFLLVWFPMFLQPLFKIIFPMPLMYLEGDRIAAILSHFIGWLISFICVGTVLILTSSFSDHQEYIKDSNYIMYASIGLAVFIILIVIRYFSLKKSEIN